MSDALEVLKKGMSTEIWGQSFYREAVERTEAEDGKQVFQSLVDEEGKHLDIICGEYAAVSADKDWVSIDEAIEMASSVKPTDIFPEASSAKDLIPDGTTDEEALCLAMDFERRGYEQYMAAAESADSPEARATWQYLAKSEDKHYAFLQKTYDYLTTNGQWYFDEQELPIFFD